MEILTRETDNLGMEQTLFKGYEFKPQKIDNIRGWKDELVLKLTNGINEERKGTKWKPVAKRTVAIRLNKNPVFKSQQECDYLLKKCEEKGFTKIFFWATKII